MLSAIKKSLYFKISLGLNVLLLVISTTSIFSQGFEGDTFSFFFLSLLAILVLYCISIVTSIVHIFTGKETFELRFIPLLGNFVTFILFLVTLWFIAFPPVFVENLGLPITAQNLPNDVAAANTEFSNRIQSKYGYLVGMPEKVAVDQLLKDGYESNHEKGYSKNLDDFEISRGNLACGTKWDVSVYVDNLSATSTDKVTSIEGWYGIICL